MKLAALLLVALWAMPVLAQRCSERAWRHVYHAKRLDRKNCITVRGRVLKSIAEPRDGDRHIRLQLDGGGQLLAEVVCATKPEYHDAQVACGKYLSNLIIPKKGQRVSITGWSVFDISHRWPEIHPVTRITILK